MHYIPYSKEKAKEEKRWALFRVGVVLIVGVIGLATYLMGYWEGLVKGEPIMDVKLPSVQALYPQALSEAKEWRSDAYMVSTDIRISTSDISATFAFDTPREPEVGLLIYFWQISEGYDIEVDEVDATGRSNVGEPIEPDDWSVDSVEAAKIAYEEKGEAFLQEHPEVDTLLAQLTRVSGSSSENTGLEINRFVWVVHFYKLRGDELRIFIDPITGEYLAEEFFEWELDPGLDKELG